MSRTVLAIAIGIVLLVIAASVGFAQPVILPGDCGPREEAVTWLENDFKEAQRFTGTMSTADGSTTTIFELWVDDEDGTFSVLESYPDGVSCLRAFGFEATIHEPIPGEPA